MLWRLNRKPAQSLRGFEMKDIGTAGAAGTAGPDDNE
jgi:hypothetical protein